MKILLFAVSVFMLCTSAFAQSNKWSSLNYSYSKGPVSPEYQLNYSVIIDNKGNGKLSYTKSSVTNEYDFKAGKKSMKKLNSALIKSKVFTVPADEMKASENLIGGPSRNMIITMWQPADLDQPPVMINVPSQINDTYSNDVFIVYELLEKMVPKRVWEKANAQ